MPIQSLLNVYPTIKKLPQSRQFLLCPALPILAFTKIDARWLNF